MRGRRHLSQQGKRWAASEIEKTVMTNWDIFNTWELPKSETIYNHMNWNDFDFLINLFNNVCSSKYNELLPLIEKWDELTKHIGKDPTHINWNKFRPLRLNREEDWSDWLSFLIENSEYGEFSKDLLGIQITEKPIEVEREVTCSSYRADIVINWHNNYYSHIEVKIGDENLIKTYDTSLKLEEELLNSTWTHFILLLSSQLSIWDDIDHSNFGNIKINSLCWEDVAIALRKALLGKENLNWKVWCYSFIGAIEQKLIGFKGHLLDQKPREKVDTKLEILKKSLNHE